MQAGREGINPWKRPGFVGGGLGSPLADYVLAVFLSHLCRSETTPLPTRHAMFIRVEGTPSL